MWDYAFPSRLTRCTPNWNRGNPFFLHLSSRIYRYVIVYCVSSRDLVRGVRFVPSRDIAFWSGVIFLEDYVKLCVCVCGVETGGKAEAVVLQTRAERRM